MLTAMDSIAKTIVKRIEMNESIDDSLDVFAYSDGAIAGKEIWEEINIELDLYRKINDLKVRTLLISSSNGKISSWNFFGETKYVYLIQFDFLLHVDYLRYSESILNTIRKR